MSKGLKGAYQVFMGLPLWARGVIGTIIVGGTTVAIYTIYKKSQKRKELKDANRAGEAAAKELGQLQNQGIVPTMSDSQFEAISLSLVEAMNGCGTDNDMVYAAFKKIKNDADIRKLIAVFGVRYYQPCAADQPLSYTKWLFNDQAYGGSLPTWLSYDLTEGEIEKVNSILRTNGVNYAF